MLIWSVCAAAVLLPALPQAPPKPLAIVNATLHQFEDGPPLAIGHRFIPGETVFFSFQVQGYQVSEDKKVHLTYQVDALDSDGVRLVKTDSGEIEAELAPQDRDWLPKARRSVVIPPHALPGEFQIVASVKDELSGQSAKMQVSFTVRGREVQPSDTLVVRNFRFLRSEEDTAPLPVAAYRSGDSLWARFDMTGYKIGEGNRIHVEYGIEIVNPEGKVVYSQPQAAVEQDSTFYLKRYVPGVLSLNIQPGTPPGEYTLVVSVLDMEGQQTYETRHVFRVQ